MTSTMHQYIVAILLVTMTAISLAQYQPNLPYYPISQESAVSLNNAPVGLYGKKSGPYGNSEEYGVSLGGAPVGIYGKRDIWAPRYPLFYEPVPYNYFPLLYPIDYYAYDNLYNGFINSPRYDQDLFPSPTRPANPGISPRRFRGSISSASSKADSVRGLTKADAVSVQGNIADDVLREIIDF